MSRTFALAILSDVHYAAAREQERGSDYEFQSIPNPMLRVLLKSYRHLIWLRDPLAHNHLLDEFLECVGEVDYVIANGDFSCNSGFVGMSDDAAFESASECLKKLRGRFGDRLRTTFGDHELGKLSFVGGSGGMPLASFYRAQQELGLKPFWQLELGRYVLIGLVSSLVALPVFEPDTTPEERPEWMRLREQHLTEIGAAFSALKPDQRVLLFCHDPTALPFLWREEAVRNKIPQIEQTIIGHLHSNLVFRASRVLAGIPPVSFLGQSLRRMSTALCEAKYWKPFRVRLCPSLAGIELLKDGGYFTAEVDSEAGRPVFFCFHRLPR